MHVAFHNEILCYLFTTVEGFFEWNPETIRAERDRYDSILREGLKIIQKELPKID